MHAIVADPVGWRRLRPEESNRNEGNTRPTIQVSSHIARRVQGIMFGVAFVATLTLLLDTSVRADSCPQKVIYSDMRYDDDFTYLRNPSCRSDLWDPIKYIPLNAKGDWYLSFGGEIRQRYERFHNPEWGQQPQSPGGYLLQRYLFFGDLHLGENVRVFAQLMSDWENWPVVDLRIPASDLESVRAKQPAAIRRISRDSQDGFMACRRFCGEAGRNQYRGVRRSGAYAGDPLGRLSRASAFISRWGQCRPLLSGLSQ